MEDSSHTPAPPQPEQLTVAQLPYLTITTTSLPSGTRYVPYTETLTGQGGYGTYTWSLVSGSLPLGFSLSPAGVISGYYVGQHSGRWNFVVQLTDQECSAPPPPTQSLTIRIN